MPDPTPAEIEAGARALAKLLPAWRNGGRLDPLAAAVLRAVLPGRDARVRAELARELECRDSLLCDCHPYDNPPTSPIDGTRMDHHCECQAVVATAQLLGGQDGTVHEQRCLCGRRHATTPLGDTDG